jgi:hypothetical protein
MITTPFLFSASTIIDRLAPGDAVTGTSALVVRDLLLIIGVGALLAVILLFWAVHHARKRKRRRREHHAPAPESAPTVAQPEAPSGRQPHRHHRQRRHRQEHRGRNPTLAETGGLPPLRPEPRSEPPA